MKRFLGVLLVLGTLALVAPLAHAATSDNATVTLGASANALVQVLDPAISLVPTATDYNNDYVEVTGASGLRVRVKSNSSTGMILKIRCPDASPQIALADLLVRTQTAAGAGGTTMSSYTAITAVDQNLWSTGAVVNAWTTVTSDIRVQNLSTYPDAGGGGTTNYSNTVTYSVVVQ
jgi:hypothetical protein